MQTYDPSTIQPEGRESEISREEISVPSQPCEGAGKAQRKAESECKPIARLSVKDKTRFLGKTSPDKSSNGCIEWIAGKNKKNYGKFSIGSRSITAHRVAYWIHHGIDPVGLHVCHTCDNPPCVNPEHLFIGTNTDNLNDRLVKNRTARGERVGGVKLKPSNIISIRGDGRKLSEIASDYNVTASTIRAVKTRRSWAHITT